MKGVVKLIRNDALRLTIDVPGSMSTPNLVIGLDVVCLDLWRMQDALYRRLVFNCNEVGTFKTVVCGCIPALLRTGDKGQSDKDHEYEFFVDGV